VSNPFLLSGPAFLAFYAGLSVVLFVVLWLWLRFTGGEARLKVSELTGDPYRIACLRHGHTEAVRIALFNLIDRGLLDFNDEYIVTVRKDGAELVRRPLDRAILAVCATPITAKQILRHQRVTSEAARYRAEIVNKGLLPPRGMVWTLILVGCGLLGGVAVTKIGIALAQGRFNVAFLAALSVAACIVLANTLANTRSRAGAETLAQLEFMTRRLKDRAKSLKSGGATNEALLLASVHGLSALPEDEFAFVTWLFPKPKARDWLDTDSGGGDGSCSSGCGGGGGCGGCGG
jgi:uncharacterized protein (TIGR04222 family)